MTKIALLGAGGKMGTRLAANLAGVALTSTMSRSQKRGASV